MISIEIEVDDIIFTEASEVLENLGLDLQMAINIFLRRIAIEKGLPISMVSPKLNSEEKVFSEKDTPLIKHEFRRRTQNVITDEMVEEVWKAFVKHMERGYDISRLSDEISEVSGMNRGSASIYLNILSNLIKGELNKRNMKIRDLEYLLGKIKTDLGSDKYENAIKSLERSVPYWKEKLPGTFGENVERLIHELKGRELSFE